jgi:hypothetical protein
VDGMWRVKCGWVKSCVYIVFSYTVPLIETSRGLIGGIEVRRWGKNNREIGILDGSPKGCIELRYL